MTQVILSYCYEINIEEDGETCSLHLVSCLNLCMYACLRVKLTARQISLLWSIIFMKMSAMSFLQVSTCTNYIICLCNVLVRVRIEILWHKVPLSYSVEEGLLQRLAVGFLWGYGCSEMLLLTWHCDTLLLLWSMMAIVKQ